MSDSITSMNFVQRMKKQMRKTNRRTKNKSIQKHILLKRDGVKMRDRTQRMTGYPKEKIGSLNKLSGHDPRIRTPLERRPSDVWHNVIKRWRLLIRIDRLPNNRNPKSISHYPRGNGELNTSYPTPNKSVGIIDVAREVREELSNQDGRGWMIYLQQRQPAFTLKVRPNGKINIIWHNKTLSPNFSLTVQFLKHLSAFVIPK